LLDLGIGTESMLEFLRLGKRATARGSKDEVMGEFGVDGGDFELTISWIKGLDIRDCFDSQLEGRGKRKFGDGLEKGGTVFLSGMVADLIEQSSFDVAFQGRFEAVVESLRVLDGTSVRAGKSGSLNRGVRDGVMLVEETLKVMIPLGEAAFHFASMARSRRPVMREGNFSMEPSHLDSRPEHALV
jgi:hypothetical protein